MAGDGEGDLRRAGHEDFLHRIWCTKEGSLIGVAGQPENNFNPSYSV